MAVLEAKASEYRQRRQRRQADLDRAALTISKTGQVLPAEDALPQAADQMLIEVTRENRQVYYQGYHIKMPTTVVAGQYYRTITDEAFILTDPVTGGDRVLIPVTDESAACAQPVCSLLLRPRGEDGQPLEALAA